MIRYYGLFRLLLVLTASQMVLGELVPKALALLYPEAVAGWVAAPLMGFAWVMALPIALLVMVLVFGGLLFVDLDRPSFLETLSDRLREVGTL